MVGRYSDISKDIFHRESLIDDYIKFTAKENRFNVLMNILPHTQI